MTTPPIGTSYTQLRQTDSGASAGEKSEPTARVEFLPGFKPTKKIAIIINGDTKEKRHVENVRRAKKSLLSQGFTDFYIIGNQDPYQDTNTHNYPMGKNGVKQLFDDVKKFLPPGSLVFFYVTGHGGNDNQGPYLSLMGQELYKVEIVSYLKVSMDARSKGVFVFDQCFSGSIPSAIINEAGIEGIAISPDNRAIETCCQNFTPEFYKGLESGADRNHDGITTMQEAFAMGLNNYRVKSGLEIIGEFQKSRIELTLENFDTFMKSNKPVLIDINATWCGPCKELSKELQRIYGIFGDQLELVNITSDTNTDAEALYSKLGIDKVRSFPTIFLKTSEGKLINISEYRDFVGISKMLQEKAGLDADKEYLLKKLEEETGYRKKQIEPYLALGRFSGREIKELIKNNVSASKAQEYDAKFNGFAISSLYKRRVTPKMTQEYGFDEDDIVDFVLHNIYPATANKYDKALGARKIIDLIEAKISPLQLSRLLAEYSPRFDSNDIARLTLKKIPVEKAAQYDNRFSPEDISDFYLERISPQRAIDLDEKYNANEIIKTSGGWIRRHFNGFELIYLADENIAVDEIGKFGSNFSGREIVLLLEAKISPDQANPYLPRFDNALYVIQLISHSISAKEANEYDNRFDGFDVMIFKIHQISPQTANSYPSSFNSKEIMMTEEDERPPKYGPGGFPRIPY